MSFDAQQLYSALQDLLADRYPDLVEDAPDFCIAFSGGPDSTALLGALTRLKLPSGLRAVHVDHGLHAASSQWAAHCQSVADSLAVDLQTIAVSVPTGAGVSVEQAARQARYEAFRQTLRPNEYLLSAQHQDDQLETVLLQLFRGGGLAGLAAMPASTPLGAGFLLRPLLSVERSEILAYVESLGIEVIADPANQDYRFDRSYLRHAIVPCVLKRWPAASATVSRSARHVATAQALLEQQAAADLRHCHAGEHRYSIARLKQLPLERLENTLRGLLRMYAMTLPPTRRLRAFSQSLTDASSTTVSELRGERWFCRTYRNALYFCELLSPVPESFSESVPSDGRLDLPHGLGFLQLVARDVCTDFSNYDLTVKFRGGGERIRLAGRSHNSTLKKLYQAAGVVPWMRGRIPLIYRGAVLIAVAGLWLADDSVVNEIGLQARWRGHPPLY